jgi:hypothetical protein
MSEAACVRNTKSEFGKFDAMCGHWDDIEKDGGWCRDRAAERRDAFMKAEVAADPGMEDHWSGVHDREESHVRCVAWSGRESAFWKNPSLLPKWQVPCSWRSVYSPMAYGPCRSWPRSIQGVPMQGLTEAHVRQIGQHEYMHLMYARGMGPERMQREIRKICWWCDDARALNGLPSVAESRLELIKGLG